MSVDEEYEMQRSWCKDGDKLIFLSCLPRASHQRASIIAGIDDAPDRLLGDVNLFLTTPEQQDEQDMEAERPGVIGEIEVMIASEEHRGKGHGRAVLEAFLQYIASHEGEIIDAFTNGFGMTENGKIGYLRVKVGEKNHQSLRLFENMEFARTEGVNWFGEIELRSQDWRNVTVAGWRELAISNAVDA